MSSLVKKIMSTYGLKFERLIVPKWVGIIGIFCLFTFTYYLIFLKTYNTQETKMVTSSLERFFKKRTMHTALKNLEFQYSSSQCRRTAVPQQCAQVSVYCQLLPCHHLAFTLGFYKALPCIIKVPKVIPHTALVSFSYEL